MSLTDEIRAAMEAENARLHAQRVLLELERTKLQAQLDKIQRRMQANANWLADQAPAEAVEAEPPRTPAAKRELTMQVMDILKEASVSHRVLGEKTGMVGNGEGMKMLSQMVAELRRKGYIRLDSRERWKHLLPLPPYDPKKGQFGF